MPPALSKAQGKLRSPAPRADFSMMKMAPMEPSRGPATSSGGLAEAEANRLMLSLANSSMLQPAGHTDWRTHRLHKPAPAPASSRSAHNYSPGMVPLCAVGLAAHWAGWAGCREEGGGVGLTEGCCCLQGAARKIYRTPSEKYILTLTKGDVCYFVM